MSEHKKKFVLGKDYVTSGDMYISQGNHHYLTDIKGQEAVTEFISISRSGVLYVREGFKWDGSSVVIDSPQCMRASMNHDSLYWLLRGGYIKYTWGTRRKADLAYYRIMREDGMNWFTADYRYMGLRLFGAPAAKPTK